MKKKITWKKAVIMAAAAVLALGTTAFAAGKVVSIVAHGSSIPDYRELPSKTEVEKVLGSSAKTIKNFENGYTFSSGGVNNVSAKGDNGETIKNYKDLSFEYNKGKNSAALYMQPHLQTEKAENQILAETYDGVDIFYYSYISKCVAGDYVMTEQDKADEASGKYVFSYGIELPPREVQGVIWTDGNVDYHLFVDDSELTKADLTKMAKEIIISE